MDDGQKNGPAEWPGLKVWERMPERRVRYARRASLSQVRKGQSMLRLPQLVYIYLF
jgi:hypothetical protein